MMKACAEDFLLFVNLWVWQANPAKVGSEVGPFISWDWQDEVFLDAIERMLGERRGNVLWEKSREMGATWMALIIAVWLCLFHPNKRVVCISHTKEAVYESGNEGTLFAKIEFILDHLPAWMKEGVKRVSGSNYKFPNRSGITGTASTKRSGVGDRVSFILLDEFSKQKDGYAIWGQTADTGPRLVIGTHYENSGCYFDLTRNGIMHKQIIHWTMHPDKRKGLYRYEMTTNKVERLDPSYAYGPDVNFVMTGAPTGGPFPGLRSPWYDLQCADRDKRDVACHLDIDPLSAMSQLFDPMQIHLLVHDPKICFDPCWEGEIEHDQGKPIRLARKTGGHLKLWIHPDGEWAPQGLYAAGTDVGAGTGATPSCLSLGNAKTGEKILEYANGRIYAHEFAELCVALCRMFKSAAGREALLVWEHHGPGVTFGNRVIELGFRQLYYPRGENPLKLGVEISDTPGWRPMGDGKRNALENYRDALRSRHFINHSKLALMETLSFKFLNGEIVHSEEASPNDPSGARKNHSDRAMSDTMLWMLMKTLVPDRERAQVEETKPVHPNSLQWRRDYWQNRERLEVEA